MSKFLYVLICCTLAIHTFFAYEITGIFPGYSGSFYWFAVPHLVLLPLCIGAIFADILLKRKITFLIASISLLCLFATYAFALEQWPGGDDGPGMAWAFAVGFASLINVIIGVPSLYLIHRNARKSL